MSSSSQPRGEVHHTAAYLEWTNAIFVLYRATVRTEKWETELCKLPQIPATQY
jgi:hypothetical protein